MKPAPETVRLAFVTKSMIDSYDVARRAVEPLDAYERHVAAAASSVIAASRQLVEAVLEDIGTEMLEKHGEGVRSSGR
jgi:hypothetical protein